MVCCPVRMLIFKPAVSKQDAYFDDGIKFLRHHFDKNFEGVVLKNLDELQIIKENVNNPARESSADILPAFKFNQS